ncbi:hypothetical protein FA15DRAFT_710853 [Coprinopsis marcescibilis]|uniref:Uncharacterized protein n=1 Tax=Coprinopsis marcescibilis TaxID=230819 RepID=A0A5C3KCK4_COPMA|nr:hypothetical protein FA15DRAFT_710853 [Coprinopsis marcescibilis]
MSASLNTSVAATDTPSTATLSAMDITRLRYIQTGANAETLRKALETAHGEVQQLKADNKALREENATLSSQLRLATHQKKMCAKGSTKSLLELSASRLGNIFMVFFNMHWDTDMMFGPRIEGYDRTDSKRYETLDANNLHVRFQLYETIPDEYHTSLTDPFSIFLCNFSKAGRELRSSIFLQIRANLPAILGDNFPCKLKPSLFLKATEGSAEREACEELRFLLGHDGSSPNPRSPCAKCPHPTYPPILFEDFNVDDPTKFMCGDLFFWLGRCVGHWKTSIPSAKSIREQSNGSFSHPSFDPHATDGFVAFLGTSLIHVLSPDKEFPNTGVGSTSFMQYYEMYLALKKTSHAIDSLKIAGGLLAEYNREVFPSYSPPDSLGSLEHDLSTTSQYRMQPAVSRMMRLIDNVANPGASSSSLLAQPTIAAYKPDRDDDSDDDDFYVSDPITTPGNRNVGQSSGLEGLLTALSLSTAPLDTNATIRAEPSPENHKATRARKQNAPAPAAKRMTHAASKKT